MRQRLNSMGAVNLVAIEEYAELKQRHDFLANQVNDLTSAKGELIKAIDEINQTSLQQFQVTFEQIRKNFEYTFHTLFGGGRAHLESLRSGITPMAPGAPIDPEALVALPARLRSAQATFEATGGLHAAALCDGALHVEVVREDVGRHNAVDKIAGWLVGASRYPAGGGVLWVSGRAGAEIVLKAARARIPVLAAVGAPSSLAVELAEAAGMTLIGFLREGRMNVYAGESRIG